MLPLLQAEEVKHAVVEYLKATYNFADKELEQAFEDFLYHQRQGMFKGPYMQLRLPFEKLEKEEADRLKELLYVRPNFNPYKHQFNSFERLSNRNGHEPAPVILTTGTGSGKTESFLYPLLDYCYQHRHSPGIKAIILYPMNALATDQARRLAEIIHEFQDNEGNFPLRDTLRAGLFIGEGRQKGKQRSTRMGADHIIEDRDTLVKSPPDILFTNFKMLDFSLMQARFHELWHHNLNQTHLLRYLVLDELHTYDGAKGSDVANLIRRLKLKLNLPIDQLVPVGTSATMAGGEEGKQELVQFFSKVFGVTVTKDAVIEEQRQDPELFFEDELDELLLNPAALHLCQFTEEDSYESYINKQLQFWGYANLDEVALGQALRRNRALWLLLKIARNGVQDIGSVTRSWRNMLPAMQPIPEQQTELVLGSLLSLISYAKDRAGSRKFPFLYLQISYWLRSMHNVLRKVQPHPHFEWESDVKPDANIMSLPPYYCRECGSSGWVGIKKENSSHLEPDWSATRKQFIGDVHNKNIYFISSLHEKPAYEIIAADYQSTDLIEAWLDPQTLALLDKRTEEIQFKIAAVRRQNGNYIQKVCPHCNAQDTLALIGTGLATIESIAAAQVLATATDPAEDQQRKLLAFTNGVQDAAHQAGFIESRNYRFGMRHAIQAVLKQQDEPVPLNSFYDKFASYWKEKAGDDVEAYYYKFLPPDSESHVRIEDYRLPSGEFKKEFDKEFKQRMAWEIWSEFSYNAAIGRTLEKSGASGVAFDEELMRDVYRQMRYWMRDNALGERIEEEAFLRFLNGFLHRLRLRGGVHQGYLRRYRTDKSSYWHITQSANKEHFLIKNFGKHTRLPRFITLTGLPQGVFDVLSTGKNLNWYSTYFLKSFPLVGSGEVELMNDFYSKLVEYLDANRLLDKKVAAGTTNYGIAEDKLFLTTDIQGFVCDTCEHQLYVGADNSSITDVMSCLQYRCPGHYKPLESQKLDYYRLVYNRGRSLRIFANDHTGLIDRDKREALEREFKTRPSAQSCNVLVATSTLEMGIDIGDLNITFNASLPPETANYLQRVGRAGRKSGTSFILNIAGRDEHDLHYFQDPQKMMQGEIRTPSCYLEARDILKRHFMAYCFDSWATLDWENNRIPLIVKQLKLKSTPEGDERFIFNRIAKYIDGNKQALLLDFLAQYEKDLESKETFEELQQELLSGVFVNRLNSVHKFLKAEIKYYEEKRSIVQKKIAKLPATDPEVTFLKGEIKALSRAIFKVYDRNVIEYLTNVGILPNYAFPETGVSFQAQVMRRKIVDGATEYKFEDFGELVRPSSSAIKELAPGNFFYSQGYKLEAQGFQLLSQDELEEHRFCSNCDNLESEVDVKDKNGTCPKCGHASWAAISNRKIMLRMRSVLSVNDNEKSKITDSSDDRDRKFYQRSVHIKTDLTTGKGAYILKRVPFGIEFFTKVKYVDINAGLNEEISFGNRKVSINGNELPEVGFIICKTCGKATERQLTPQEINLKLRSYHFGYCSNKNELYAGARSQYFDEVYLYRQFTTEALKVLLPVQDFRTEEKVAIFKAGLQLGLKSYYRGHPDHVHIRDYEEYNQGTKKKERYLVMYETIPGGTGYLSKLFDTAEFTKLLQVAYDKLRLCSCKADGKDGCYQCIYTYGNQYERSILSRQEAEKLFKDIVDKAEEWNPIDSLQGVTDFGNIEESDLEHKFVNLLKQKASLYPSWEWQEELESGIKIYKLTLTTALGSIRYELWPQNKKQWLSHVALKTRPDFLIKCVSCKLHNGGDSFEMVESVKDIALYLDGYYYHASKDHRRLPSDIAIRNSIIDSGRYYFWALTWDDVDRARENQKDQVSTSLNEDITGKIFSKHPLTKNWDKDIFAKSNLNSFERFIKLLLSPIEQVDVYSWANATLFALQEKVLQYGFEREYVDNLISGPDEIDLALAAPGNPKLYAYSDKVRGMKELGLAVFAQAPTLDVIAKVWFDEQAEEWEKDNWELFCQAFNLLQFSKVKGSSLATLAENVQAPAPDDADELEEILENFSEDLHGIVRELVAAGVEINTEYDFDIMEDGEIVAQAALGSHPAKFVIKPFDDASRAKFESLGYKVFTVEGFDISAVLV